MSGIRFVLLFSLLLPLNAGSLPSKELEAEFRRLSRGFDGRVGICVEDPHSAAYLNGEQRFSLQSVIKLLVGAAVLEKVDHQGWNLSERIVVRRQDLSLYVQPLADLVNKTGSYTTTTGDLVRRAIVDSDSAATDILIAKLGGPQIVQSFLNRHAIGGVRLDRDERHLQTQIAGIQWKPEYVDAKLLDQAMKAVPDDVRSNAYEKYQKDERDTATPKGICGFLSSLAQGKLLSASSTDWLLRTMTQTATFPDRLKAGVSNGWTIAHKTGTSGSWKGVTAATNDVGVLKAPDGTLLPIVVFIGDSREPSPKKAALMAAIARTTIAHYH